MKNPKFRDIYNRPKLLKSSLAAIEKRDLSQRNKDIIQKFVTDATLGRIGRILQEQAILKYLTVLPRTIDFLGNKDLDSIDQDDADKIYVGLLQDTFCQLNGAPFSKSSKEDYVKVLKSFFATQGKAHLVSTWQKRFGRPDDGRPAPSKEEIERLVLSAKDPDDAVLWALFFDSGARPEELYNCRFKHFEQQEDCFSLRLEFSKTYPRTIKCVFFRKLYEEFVKRHKDKKPEDFLFPLQNATYRKRLRFLTLKVLGKILVPYDLRHASATHFATVFAGDTYKMDKRFGWAIGSDQSRTYIDRLGLADTSDEIVKHLSINELQEENETLHAKVKSMGDDIKQLKELILKKHQPLIDRLSQNLQQSGQHS